MTFAPRIKFCGITSLDDAQLAIDAGAWAIGLILWDGSPRRCALPEAEAITARFRRTVEVCGVFVNATLDEVAATVDGVGLTMVQLHGDEGPSFCEEVRRRTGTKVIKAVRVSANADMLDLERYHTDFHLLDAYRPGMRGGTGETFDWHLVDLRMGKIPLILSGGLTPDNVAAGIAATHPFAVDTASGTESAPGVKDPAKLRAFAAAVHATATEPADAPPSAPIPTAGQPGAAAAAPVRPEPVVPTEAAPSDEPVAPTEPVPSDEPVAPTEAAPSDEPVARTEAAS